MVFPFSSSGGRARYPGPGGTTGHLSSCHPGLELGSRFLPRPRRGSKSRVVGRATPAGRVRRFNRGLSTLIPDRKRVVEGKSVSVRVDLGGSRIIKKNKNK